MAKSASKKKRKTTASAKTRVRRVDGDYLTDLIITDARTSARIISKRFGRAIERLAEK